KTNLLKRYSDLGITNLTISNFEDYVDSDGDGLINKYNLGNMFTSLSNGESNTNYTSNESTIVLPVSVQTAEVNITEGTIVKNGADTGSKTTTVSNGDKIAIKLTSGDYYGKIVESTLSLTYLGYTLTAKYSITNRDINWVQKTSSASWNGICSHSLVFDNKIWVISKVDNNTYCNNISNSTDGITWTKVTDNVPWGLRAGYSSVVFDNKIWIFGGTYTSIHYNDVWNSTDGITWTKVTDNGGWSPRIHSLIVVFNNKIWLIGGFSNYSNEMFSGTDYNDVWNSTDGITWTKVTDNAQWKDIDGYTSIVFGNKIWIIGGHTNSYNNKEIWNSTDGITWTKITDNAPWGQRSGHASVVFDNKIWVLGGFSYSQYSKNNDAWYSIDGINWTRAKATNNVGWDRRSFLNSVVFNNKILILGINNSRINDVWSSE
ncbi:MAG: hypothetical protein A2Z98_07370, partial [Spirochaetes bacterium GWB1_27_13]